MQFHIEVKQEVMLPRVVEGVEVIRIIFKEGTFTIGSLQCTPMVMRPVAMVAEANFLNGGMRRSGTDRNHQVLRALRHSNATAVAPRLLDIVLILIHLGGIGMSQCHIVGNGGQIGSRKGEQGRIENWVNGK